MAELDHDVNRDTPPPDLLPEKEMELEIINSERKEGKNNLSITWQVVSGDYAGRKLFETLNIWYINEDDAQKQEQTRSMARRRLTELCVACGKEGTKDSSDLHGITVMGKIKTRAAANGFEARSEVGAVRSLKAKPGAAAASNGKPAWHRK